MPSETTYTIRVAGPLDDPTLEEFAPTRDGDDATTLTVTVADQAQLHGVLARLRDSDAVLAELRATTPVAAPPAALERPLHTERLTLRSVTVADAEAVWRYRRLASVAEWLTGSAGDLDRFRASFADPDRLGTTIVIEEGHAADAPVIGDLMLRRGDAWAQTEVADRARRVEAELGWVLNPAFTGHGYATEAVRELLRHCFEDLGLHRVTANCFLENDASWRLMERLGMRRELHTRRESLHRSGRWLDGLGYAILDDEWPPPA